MAHPSLKATVALYRLGSTDTQRLVDAAHDALKDGVYSYSLGELATFPKPSWSDVLPLFLSALEELGIDVPTVEQAITLFLETQIVKLAEEIRTASVVFDDLRVACDTVFHNRIHFTDLFDGWLSHLYDFEYEAEMIQIEVWDIDDRNRQLRVLNEKYVTIAQEWCRNRWKQTFDHRWLTSDVVSLAHAIHLEKAFEKMPILADALTHAGCDNDEILSHCRSAGSHFRGCWVVDLLLDSDRFS